MKIANQFKLGEMVGVIGRVWGEPDNRTTTNGNKVCKFSLSIGKDDSLPENKQTVFANCAAWRNAADYAEQIRKGDIVFAIGRSQTKDYKGKPYTTLNVEWMNVMGLGSFGTNPALQAIAEQAQAANIPTTIDGQNSEDFSVVGDDSDLPF
jgi:single-stranded DNA-binding protein